MDKQRLMDIYSQKAMMLGGLKIGGDMEELYGGVKKQKPRAKKNGIKHVMVGGVETKRVAKDRPPRGARSDASKKAAQENPWIKHVKKYAADHNVSYRDALKMPAVKESYKKKN